MARFTKVGSFQLKTVKDLNEFRAHQGVGGYLYTLTPRLYTAEDDGITYMVLDVTAYRVNAPDKRLIA